jgi:hypothetical protein
VAYGNVLLVLRGCEIPNFCRSVKCIITLQVLEILRQTNVLKSPRAIIQGWVKTDISDNFYVSKAVTTAMMVEAQSSIGNVYRYSMRPRGASPQKLYTSESQMLLGSSCQLISACFLRVSSFVQLTAFSAVW